MCRSGACSDVGPEPIERLAHPHPGWDSSSTPGQAAPSGPRASRSMARAAREDFSRWQAPTRSRHAQPEGHRPPRHRQRQLAHVLQVAVRRRRPRRGGDSAARPNTYRIEAPRPVTPSRFPRGSAYDLQYGGDLRAVDSGSTPCALTRRRAQGVHASTHSAKGEGDEEIIAAAAVAAFLVGGGGAWPDATRGQCRRPARRSTISPGQDKLIGKGPSEKAGRKIDNTVKDIKK